MRATLYVPAWIVGELRDALYVRLAWVALDIEERGSLSYLRGEGWQRGLRARLGRVMGLLDVLGWEDRPGPAVVAVDMGVHGRELIETLSSELSAARAVRAARAGCASRAERVATARVIIELQVLLYAARAVAHYAGIAHKDGEPAGSAGGALSLEPDAPIVFCPRSGACRA